MMQLVMWITRCWKAAADDRCITKGLGVHPKREITLKKCMLSDSLEVPLFDNNYDAVHSEL